MQNLPILFDSEQSYQQFFVDGLKHMLKHSDELGVFILVLANATYDRSIFSVLADDLKQKFNEYVALFNQTNDQLTLGAADDVAVFIQLMAIGFENCGLNQVRQEGDWVLQFNPLRSFRPARNSQVKVTDINQPFDENGFNFNKPFLVKEELWQGDIDTKKCRILYNKFPFADFHSLLIIDSMANKKQWIEKNDIDFLWQFYQSLESFSSLQIAYNSIGAYASINHQHFQLSISHDAIIEKPKWRHNGGSEEYPVTCIVASNAKQAWLAINDLQLHNEAFNFLIKKSVMYIMPRLKQGQYTQKKWTSGFGWGELCGLFSIFQESDYHSLNNTHLLQEFEKLKL